MANPTKPRNTDSMSFWQHLDVLRGVLWRAIAIWMVFAVCFFIWMPDIFHGLILWPCRGDFPSYLVLDRIAALWPEAGMVSSEGFHVDLINTELASQFFIHMSSACWLAFVAALPVILFLVWGFVRPALYPVERRRGATAFAMGFVMFCIGVAIGYLLVFPLTVRFLAGYQLSEAIPNIISISSYIDMFFTLILVMGLLFELPLLAWVLGKMGLLSRRFFNRYRRHAVVVLLILAALVTPTGDPFTLMAVFIPVYAVWELGALLVPKASGSDA